ncbi:MAG: T9SS type A sorting domain-containing protein [Flavobacterium sp.]|nr:T9SS type A sorting domain-containing protein [Flavobacterium sp.]MBP8156929.1 T9SS type A sorting domain-containing protein [Flavobacterium sp.]
MKKLLLLFFTVAGFVSSNAQTSCATAVPVTAGSTVTVAGITGTYQLACDNVNGELTTGALGAWYSYTATANGQVTLTSSLPQNVAPNSDDTRVSVYSGACGTLTCVAGADDDSGTNFLTTITFDVVSGSTYYIQWDNRWSAAGFDFSVAFVGISCFPLSVVNAPTNIATNSITLNWNAATGTPQGYEVEYGPFGFTQGAGTVLSTATNSITISGLAASTAYSYFVRSNCGLGGFSDWTPSLAFTTAKVCPQTVGFETNAELVGMSTFGNGAFGLSANAPANAQAGNFYWIFNTNATAVSNNWLFTAPFSLQANEAVTITFWIRSTTVRSLRLTVGNDALQAAQTTQLWANTAFNNLTYTQFTANYTAPTTGIYYFGFNDISAAGATATLRLDSINFSSVLSTNDYLTSKFSVYPNPASNTVNFSNEANAVVSTIEMSDLNGRVVKTANVNATEGQVSVSDLATGVYMMKITTDQGVAIKKIVKD